MNLVHLVCSNLQRLRGGRAAQEAVAGVLYGKSHIVPRRETNSFLDILGALDHSRVQRDASLATGGILGDFWIARLVSLWPCFPVGPLNGPRLLRPEQGVIVVGEHGITLIEVEAWAVASIGNWTDRDEVPVDGRVERAPLICSWPTRVRRATTAVVGTGRSLKDKARGIAQKRSQGGK